MFGVKVEEDSLATAMEFFYSVKERGGDDKEAVYTAILWYLTSEEQKRGMMS